MFPIPCRINWLIEWLIPASKCCISKHRGTDTVTQRWLNNSPPSGGDFFVCGIIVQTLLSTSLHRAICGIKALKGVIWLIGFPAVTCSAIPANSASDSTLLNTLYHTTAEGYRMVILTFDATGYATLLYWAFERLQLFWSDTGTVREGNRKCNEHYIFDSDLRVM